MRTRMRAGSVAFVGLLLAASTGCHTLQPSTPLAVHVQDVETHAPVPGATVRLWRFGPHADERDQGITAGADGIAHAHLAPPDEGGVMVEVSAPGYLSSQTTLPSDIANALASAKPLHPYKGPPLAFTMEMFAGPRPVVELIVPAGYRGMVKAEIRARGDGPWPPGQRAFTYTVPATGGVVHVDGPLVFGQEPGPEVIAKFADGTPLPMDAKNGEVAFRWVRRNGNDIYFAVGTLGDADAVRRTLGNISDSAPPSKSSDKGGGGGGRGGRGGGGGRGGRGGGGGMGGGMGGP